MRSRITAFATIAITVALGAVLGACSSVPLAHPSSTPKAESVSAACDALEDEARAASDGMLEGDRMFSTDATGGAQKLAAAAARFDKAAATVHNAKVSELAKDTNDSIAKLSDLVTAYAADSTTVDPKALPAASADADSAFVALAAACNWSPESDQPASASCNALQGEAAALSSELSDASSLLTADPTGAAEKLTDAAARFDKAAGAVDNAQVSALATDLSEKLNVFSGLINTLATDASHPDEKTLTAGSDALNTAFSALITGCGW